MGSLLGKHRRGREDNITIDHTEIGWKGLHWMDLT